MATIAIMVGGAVLNASTFIAGDYLAKALGGEDDAALRDKALEDYQAPWLDPNKRAEDQAKQNFTNTDYAFKLYNQAHPYQVMAPLKEPEFSDFYQQSEQQKKGELVFWGAPGLLLWAMLLFVSFK